MVMREAALMINQTRFADLRIGSLQVRPGVGTRQFMFNVDFDFRVDPPSGFESASHLSVRGEVSVKPAEASASAQRIGPTALSRSGIVTLPGAFPNKRSEKLNIDLVRNQLADIERLRTGGGLEFQFDLFPVLFCASEVFEMPMIQLGLEIGQSQWISFLSQLDFQRTLLLEIPLDGDASLKEWLLRARAAFDKGEYRDAVGVCREVLESLAAKLGDEEAVKREDFSDLRNKDKPARLRLLRRALTTVTHPAHHTDEVATSFDWNRADAEGVLAMTAGVLLLVDEAE